MEARGRLRAGRTMGTVERALLVWLLALGLGGGAEIAGGSKGGAMSGGQSSR